MSENSIITLCFDTLFQNKLKLFENYFFLNIVTHKKRDPFFVIFSNVNIKHKVRDLISSKFRIVKLRTVYFNIPEGQVGCIKQDIAQVFMTESNECDCAI